MRTFFFILLRLTGIPFLLREIVQRRRVSILCYHDPEPGTADIHFEWIKRNYNVIALKDYLDARTGQGASVLPPKSLVITFDDGHMGNYRLKPIIKKHGLPVTIFLCSDIVGTNRHYWWTHGLDRASIERLKVAPDLERLALLKEKGFAETQEFAVRQALSDEEIADLRNIVDFQSHTRFHPDLPRCSRERAEDEIGKSKARLEQRYGLKIYALAYPSGNYSARDMTMAEQNGYACALTIDGGFNDMDAPLYQLRRLRMDDHADLNELVVKTSGLWDAIQGNIGNRPYGYVKKATE